jgi:hypothetical protein
LQKNRKPDACPHRGERPNENAKRVPVEDLRGFAANMIAELARTNRRD